MLDADHLVKAVAMEFGLKVDNLDRLDVLAAINHFLLLQVEEVGQAGDEGPDVGAEGRPVAAQIEDAALHLVGAGLGQLDQAVGLQLGLLHLALRLLPRVLPDLLGGLLGGEERVLEDDLALLGLVHHVLQALDLLGQGVVLALERGHLLRHQGEVGAHLLAVAAAELLGEGLPLDVHGRDLHGLGSHVWASGLKGYIG